MTAAQTFTVDTCAQRQDGEWLVTFRKAAGWAVSAVQVAPGSSVRVANQRVV